MAKWGEGDPRWIVEERPDATNVNNWHWTEKNADNWSKKKIKVCIRSDCMIAGTKHLNAQHRDCPYIQHAQRGD